MAVKRVLACEQCGSRNYSVPAPSSGTTERLQMKKFCKRCNAHTLHRETK
ncbi:50S ribosomal protein L33 [Mangrovibacillus cuniculi]|uniref:Large ribosomal subunit protein bL33 n=1 Tax=Mangrovibacillus cuniculi TaxID=2593652 RepID=A0A7S8HGX2_9BACI|nr:50S ribosomal protein L33 [Mangrovibacillus cuniculi]QPC48021.1 50S ribosomal protein L33 [Mangrovibacillus cuniculi]